MTEAKVFITRAQTTEVQGVNFAASTPPEGVVLTTRGTMKTTRVKGMQFVTKILY